MLQIIFGDDEHTAADGPYPRTMKTRKWVYVTAAAATLLSLRLYDQAAAAEFLKVISLPGWLLSQATLVGLIYLLIQYALLIGQLVSSYDIVLAERLAFRRAEELSQAQERLSGRQAAVIDQYEKAVLASRTAVAQAKKERADLRSARDKLSVDIKRLDQSLFSDADHERQQQNHARYAELDVALVDAERKVAQAEIEQIAGIPRPVVDDDPEVLAAKAELDLLRSQNPAVRAGYRQIETVIDATRIGLPAVVGLAAAFNLLRSVMQAQ